MGLLVDAGNFDFVEYGIVKELGHAHVECVANSEEGRHGDRWRGLRPEDVAHALSLNAGEFSELLLHHSSFFQEGAESFCYCFRDCHITLHTKIYLVAHLYYIQYK